MKLSALTLWLGRHETRGSRLWVYIENILPQLVAELEERGVSLSVVGAGSTSLRAAAEELLENSSSSTELVWLRDPLGMRHLGNLRDIFVIPTSRKRRRWEGRSVFHGLSNTLPLLGTERPRIVTMHDILQAFPPIPPKSLFLNFRTNYYRRYLTYILRSRADWIITGHEKTKREIEEIYARGERTTVVHPPLSPSYCEPLKREELPRGQSDYLLAFLSTDPRKNLARVLEAFEAYQGDEELKIVLGAPTLSSSLRDRVERGSKARKISIELAPDRTELRKIFREARATLFPSLGEGFGYPIYESLSQGVPVLTSKELVISDLSKAERLVVTCDPWSLDSIKEGLNEVLTLKPTPEARLEASQEVQKALHPEKCVELLVACYFSVANS